MGGDGEAGSVCLMCSGCRWDTCVSGATHNVTVMLPLYLV